MSAVRWHRPKLRVRILAGDEPAWLLNHVRRNYVRQAIIATPKWVDVEGLRALERERDERTRATGIPHVLAHVVPLNHPKICGLNVPSNLKVVPWAVNASEGNAWGGDVPEPAQGELPL